ncbi:MAG: AMP-binding protein [Deltaproteobacteria bacterium]|jgi:2,3-dihydroxybenzoate-AMP ligase/mycobactin salicyl-AMP ligase|nr:AMP-binding protein [Deltaproteobacteria bacterium]
MFKLLEGAVPYKTEDEKRYIERGWWRGLTLGDYLDLAADIHPEKEAFIDRISRYTYGEAREKTDRLAVAMIKTGIQPLDRVLIQLPNWNEFIFAYFACQKIGAIPVLLIDRYRQFEINRLIKLTGAKYWIVAARTSKFDYAPLVNSVLTDQPQIKRVITVRGKIDGEAFKNMEDMIHESPLTKANCSMLLNNRPDPGQVAHMGVTGGTTGEPKIVPRTHYSLACAVEFCSKSWDQHCEDINMVVGPVGHDLSFSKGLLGSIITQGTLIFQKSTDNADICRTIEKEKVTSIIWVPTLAQRLLQYEEIGRYNLGSLKKMHSGGGASHSEMVKEITARLNIRYYNGYGATEGMTCITRTTDSYKTLCHTVGRPTFPYDTYKVVDSKGNELPCNTPGELMVKGPSVFSGYYNEPEENARMFDENGFFKTGDIASIDEQGYITLCGRIKEMINRGGESISATDIEKLIILHPDVMLVGVIPMRDKLMGERVCAYIELRKSAALTFDKVIDFLKSKNASVLQLPEQIVFIKNMPMTNAGKIDKEALRTDIEKRLLEDARPS